MVATARPDAPRSAVVGIALSVTLAVAVGVLRTVNAEPAERAVEVAGNIAFGIVFAAPALLALLGIRGRPSLLVGAGALDLALAFLTLISLVGLAFVPPAILFFVAAGRMRRSGSTPARAIASVLVAALLGTLALFALFVRDDPVCWAFVPSRHETVRLDPSRFVHGSSISMSGEDLPPGATESGCSSDTISGGEAGAAIALVAAMLAASWLVARPREPLGSAAAASV